MLTDRYVNPEMGRIWSEEAKFDSWMEVETAAAEVMADAGIVPAEAAKEIRAKGAYSIERIDAIEKDVKHDVIAFTQAMAENVGEAGRFIHFGLTSYDVVDTALGIRLRDATDLMLEERRRVPGRLESGGRWSTKRPSWSAGRTASTPSR